MNDQSDQPDSQHDDGAGVAVPMGPALPLPQDVPVLAESAELPSTTAQDATDMVRHSTVGEGMTFDGEIVNHGLFTLAGELLGNVDAGQGQVTITETGCLVGDVHARTIAVFGRSEGTLDAAGGKVSLHDTAVVSGRVRYAHLQVNGADLNAQLERARGDVDTRNG
jgi:cytoskeletal protein CcmA (bactofilin family)